MSPISCHTFALRILHHILLFMYLIIAPVLLEGSCRHQYLEDACADAYEEGACEDACEDAYVRLRVPCSYCTKNKVRPMQHKCK